jgi:hypothetical protein
MEGDALVILDCCMASAAVHKVRSQGSRIYQLLAASSEDSVTYGPGPNSFTTALCDSLEELLAEKAGGPFLLTQLSEKINEKRTRQPSVTWDRLRSYKRSVQLGPLHQTQEGKQERKAAFQKNEPEKASITLRLSLKVNDLGNEQTQTLAEQLPRLCHETKIPLRRIYWEGMTANKRGVSRAIEIGNEEFSDVTEDEIHEAAIGGALFQAVHQVNAAYRVRNAFKRKHESRLRACDGTSGGLFFFARALMMLSAVLAGSLFFTETRERCILLAAARPCCCRVSCRNSGKVCELVEKRYA